MDKPAPEDAWVDWFYDQGERHLARQQVNHLKGQEAMATKEHIDQLGISVAPNGSLVVRYINGDGQRVTLDLTAIIEEKVEAGIKVHMEKYHGHQI